MDSPDFDIRLIGRSAELDLLDTEVQRADAGELRVVLIEGGAGVGKTRLMEEAVRLAGAGTVVLRSRSARVGTTTSFGAWLEAVDGFRAARTRVAASLPVIPVGASRHVILEGLTQVLVELARTDRVVMAMDDIHHADDSSWEALRYVSRRLREHRLAILLTARPEGLRLNPVATDVLISLADGGQLHRMPLEPLSLEEMEDLAATAVVAAQGAGAVVPRRLATWLMERSLGHPLFALSLLRTLLAEGADLTAPHLSDLPSSLRERVSLDLHRLTDRQREVLEVMAVIDRRSDPAEITAALDGSVVALMPILDDLIASGLIEMATATGSYQIKHPLIQEAVYELIGPGRRMLLHRSVARMLRHRSAWGEAAGHFARAAPLADNETLEVLCEAIRRAEDQDLYREALAILEGLLEVLPEDDRRWMRVFDSLSWTAEWVIGHLAEGDARTAIEALRRVERVAPENDLLRGNLNLYLATLHSIGTGEIDLAETRCRAAIDHFERAGAGSDRLLAENEMVWIQAARGQTASAVKLVDQLLARADLDRTSRMHLAGSAGFSLTTLGRLEEAAEMFAIACRLAERDENIYRRLWVISQRSVAKALAGRLREGVADLEEALATDPARAGDALAFERMAQLSWLAGEFDDCLRWIEESQARRAVRGSKRRAWGLAFAARAHGELGMTTHADRVLSLGAETYSDGDVFGFGTWIEWSRAVVSHQSGDLDGARRHFRLAATQLEAIQAAPYLVLLLFDWADLEFDRGGAGHDVLEELVDVATGVSGELVPALIDTAQALLAGDDRGTGPDWLESAGYLTHALIAFDLHARQAAGEERRSRHQEVAAKAMRMGAVWRRDRAIRRLSEMGRGGRRAASSVLGPEALTAREREVVRLAAQGHTAREIAEQLLIGTRTVESHLARAYPKLGVASKRELVTRADDLGLVRREGRSST